MPRQFAPFLMCLTLLAADGCQRAPDGTVLIPKPLDYRLLWERPPSSPQAAPGRVASGVFPVAPQSPVTATAPTFATSPKPRKRPRLAAATPVEAVEPAKPLACRNVSEPGKRVRVVCE